MTRLRLELMAAASGFAAVLFLASAAQAQMNITTYHYDNNRTGWNSSETTLTQGNVSNSTFGLLHTVALDDQVDTQPLIVNNETINGGQHNVVYVTTENNSVYAIDAQSGQVLLQTNLGQPVNYPLGCGNNGPEVGINGTPVIDTSAGLMYVIAYTLKNNTPTYYLHALSLTTLADSVSPVLISASGTLSNGKPYNFNASNQRQRPGMLLSNGTIYAGFGSFCDFAANDSRGWVLGWQESTLAPLASNRLNNTKAKAPDDFFLTAVWMSGYGLAANSSGSVYFVTGNSDYSGTTYSKTKNIAESAAVMSADLTTRLGLFTPSDHSQLDQGDTDFGSGGIMVLPPQGGKFPDIAAAAGKDGNLYLLDADKLGKEFGSYQVGGCWCGPSYYQGSDGTGRIVTSGNSSVMVWALEGDKTPSLTRKSQFNGIANGQDPGFFTTVSSNGTTAGSSIVWAVGRPTDNNPADVSLYAVNPDNGKQLFSETAGAWPNTGGNSNIVPIVDNGLAYVASNQVLTIFGPGGHGKPDLRNVHSADLRKPLAPGEHEIYGFVREMHGAEITVQKRGGETVRVDASAAQHASKFAEPSVGHALIARGTVDKSGLFTAGAILHAKDHAALWPSDR